MRHDRNKLKSNMCCEIVRMKNFGEKMGEKMSLCVVWLRERKENFYAEPIYFPLGSAQNFSLQNGEKRKVKMLRHTV